MRQVGLGRRPISNPAWLSADGPVVRDPESASGISDCGTSIKRPPKEIQGDTNP